MDIADVENKPEALDDICEICKDGFIITVERPAIMGTCC